MKPKILFIRLSSLGDILHALPALRSLRAAHPGAQIDWLVEERMQFLLAAVPGVDTVHTLETRAWRRAPWRRDGWRAFFGLVRRLRAERYDYCLDLQGLVKTGFLAYLSGSRLRIGFNRRAVRERPADWFYNARIAGPASEIHIARQNQALARAAGGTEVDLRSELHATPEDDTTVERILLREQLSRFAIINPGGGWTTKRWSPARYGRLAGRIQAELELPVVVTTGPGEEGLYEEMLRHCPGAPPRHVRVSFLQMIPLCRAAHLFIGGDTGPYHLACALGTPTVGIFGPTSPIRNGPLDRRDETLFRVLHCSFCNGRTCPTQNECMDISVEEVFSAVKRRVAAAQEVGDSR